jgi:hypothetical protein
MERTRGDFRIVLLAFAVALLLGLTHKAHADVGTQMLTIVYESDGPYYDRSPVCMSASFTGSKAWITMSCVNGGTCISTQQVNSIDLRDTVKLDFFQMLNGAKCNRNNHPNMGKALHLAEGSLHVNDVHVENRVVSGSDAGARALKVDLKTGVVTNVEGLDYELVPNQVKVVSKVAVNFPFGGTCNDFYDPPFLIQTEGTLGQQVQMTSASTSGTPVEWSTTFTLGIPSVNGRPIYVQLFTANGAKIPHECVNGLFAAGSPCTLQYCPETDDFQFWIGQTGLGYCPGHFQPCATH